MCTVSMIMDFGKTLPEQYWDVKRLNQFKILVQQLDTFDKDIGLTECQDPLKAEWIEHIEMIVEQKDEINGTD